MRKRNLMILLTIVIFIPISVWIFQIRNGYVPLVDQWTIKLVEGYAGTPLYYFAFAITQLGSRQFLIPFVLIASVILALIYKHLLPPFIFAGGTLFSYFINGFIKDIIPRERPSIIVAANAVGGSFPSGHAMISMVCYGLLAFFITRKVKVHSISIIIQVSLSLLVFLIGISRFIINAHYLTDVLAGFGIGFILLICYIYLYEKLFPKES
ncbi:MULTISPECIES: phosphatase PAP2 family protein [Bacillaceae]|nr:MULTISPECIES: phosphatase PAP2 family protein [Bacillaceae]MED4473149.1 phosphatase PAP2 family protein [Oceanobacillus caeni]